MKYQVIQINSGSPHYPEKLRNIASCILFINIIFLFTPSSSNDSFKEFNSDLSFWFVNAFELSVLFNTSS